VVGGTPSELTTVTSPTNPEKIEVAYQTPSGPVIVSAASLAGGKLGGVLEFRSESLEPAQNALGRVAIGLASSFNAQHQLGVDLNGDAGGDFFTVASPVVSANNGNTGSADATASISDANALTTSDYRLQFDGTDYTLTRLSDNTVTAITGFPQTVDGIVVDLTGTADPGDSFLIRPTVDGASSFSVAITDPKLIAAAAALPNPPVDTAGASTNTGTAAISAGTVDSSYAPLSAAVTLTYSLGTNELSGFPANEDVTVSIGGVDTVYPGNDPAPAVVYADGATISFGGVSFTLSGVPGDGDSFSVESNSVGPGDNRNALALADVQHDTCGIVQWTFARGSAATATEFTSTLEGFHGRMVGSMGLQALRFYQSQESAGLMVNSLQQQRDSVSAVSLDEEMINLIKYQQAYTAASKLLSVSDEMLIALINSR